MIRILGIDPGIAITGFAVLDCDGAQRTLVTYGVIRTPEGMPLAERLVLLRTDIKTVIERYPGIHTVGIEELFFAKNAKTAFMVGQARGVLLCTLAEAHIPIQEFKPVEVKSLVVGHGQAKKTDVQRMIQLIFGLATIPQPDDAADAIAIALSAAAQYHT